MYNSHSACFCCLFEPPEHALPCGHILCTPCIKDYGQLRSKTEVEIHGCPIESRVVHRYQTWRIHLKPETAGVRILTLDGYVGVFNDQTRLKDKLTLFAEVAYEVLLNLKCCDRLSVSWETSQYSASLTSLLAQGRLLTRQAE